MRLKHRIQIQRDYPTQDATGQPISEWRTIRNCWAKVEDTPRGGEVEQAAKVAAVAQTEIEIRYPHDGDVPVATDRVRYVERDCERMLNIEAVKRLDGSTRMMLLICSESQDG